MLNLGRGAAGPSDYLGAWSSIASPIASSRAVIVVLMAGRSSANVDFPSQPGVPSGPISMARDAGVRRLVDAHDPRAWLLVNQSLHTALSEYVELARRIRNRAALLRRAPPALLLVWLSECPMDKGCPNVFTFPQYYVDPARVRAVAWEGGYTLVDASYGWGRGLH